MVLTGGKLAGGGRGGVFLGNKVGMNGLKGGLNDRTEVFLFGFGFAMEFVLF